MIKTQNINHETKNKNTSVKLTAIFLPIEYKKYTLKILICFKT